MSKTWEHQGYEVEESMKPHDENFKDDYHQYFFIVKKGGERVFKYCIWLEKSAIFADPMLAAELMGTKHKIPESVYQRAKESVVAKIEARDFEDCLLKVDLSGHEEICLEGLPEKLG